MNKYTWLLLGIFTGAILGYFISVNSWQEVTTNTDGTILEYNAVVNKYRSKQLYQGPVPEGYDEEHFRQTGETKETEKVATPTAEVETR